jgi:hypothetical protein
MPELSRFLPDAGRVEVGEVPAFGAVGGINHAVDERRTSRQECAGECEGELRRRGRLAQCRRTPRSGGRGGPAAVFGVLQRDLFQLTTLRDFSCTRVHSGS